jgi:hypothetical protein
MLQRDSSLFTLIIKIIRMLKGRMFDIVVLQHGLKYTNQNGN